MADEYWVMRETSSKTCRVQGSKEFPIGERFKGPFETKEEAMKVMCEEYDPTMEDGAKCWVVNPDDACK